MPARPRLFQEVYRYIRQTVPLTGVRATSPVRLALFVTGLLAAKSCVVQAVARELASLHLTRATDPDHIARRLRRTLGDGLLDQRASYCPLLSQVLAWQHPRLGSRAFLIVDESTKRGALHLLQVSLAYQGSSLPLAWDVWEQNVPLPEGRYWQAMDAVLDQVAALIPAGIDVTVLADRAYDIPPFIDRIRAHGWHVIVRLKDGGTVRFRDQQGQEWALATLIEQQVPASGHRWKARGYLFKNAGWRSLSVVSLWAAGYDQRLTVLTDLPPTWCIAAWYRRRFWCEPGFRNTKSRGWQWECSQVQDVERTERLLTVMAWATVLVLCLGQQEAARRLQQVPDRRIGRHGPGTPRAVKDSLFLLGLIAVGSWLYGAVRRHIRWTLPDLMADSWEHQWYAASAHRFLATIPFRTKTVRP